MGMLHNNTILRLTPNPLSNNTNPAGNEAPGIIMFGEPWRGFPMAMERSSKGTSHQTFR